MNRIVGERKGREEIMREIKFAVDSLSEESYSLLERLTEFMAVLVSFANRNKMNLASIYDEYLCWYLCFHSHFESEVLFDQW